MALNPDAQTRPVTPAFTVSNLHTRVRKLFERPLYYTTTLLKSQTQLDKPDWSGAALTAMLFANRVGVSLRHCWNRLKKKNKNVI